MAFTNENSEWVEFLPTGPGLALTERFSLVQGGPKDRRNYTRDCLESASEDPALRAALLGDDVDPQGPCWWDVQVMGWTNTTSITFDGIPTLIDPRVVGQRNPIPRATLKYLGDDIQFDIGPGAHFSVYAPSISLGMIAPVGSVRVGDGGQSNFIGTPMAPLPVTSVAVNGIIAACATRTQPTNLTLTETRVLVASADVEIPPRARTLEIFQNTASLPPTPLNWLQDAVTLFDLGQIDFPAATPGRTGRMEIPAGASIVRTGAAVRTLTFVWGLAL